MDDLKKKLINRSVFSFSLGRSALFFLENKPLPYIKSIFDTKKTELPPKDFQKASEIYLRKLFEEEAENIASGYYPASVLAVEKPTAHFKRLLKIWSDSFLVSYRQSKKQNKIFSKEAKKLLGNVPKYYQRNFHYQTDGYLSEKSAEIYDHQVDLLFSGATGAMRRSLLPALVCYQKKKKKLKILEVGCGAGSFTKFLAQTLPDAEIVALDISQPYLKVAQRKLQKFNNVSFINGLGESLDFKDESFDMAISVFLYHELPSDIREQVMQESKRVLKPGGLFGLVDSLQVDDHPELNWALYNFPKIFHEPFYKNYVDNPIEDLVNTVFNVEKSNVSTHFLSKCVTIEKSL